MPDKELQGFNINFHTNAAQAAEDVDKLNEAQQRLSQDTEKSDKKSSKRRTRSNKDLRQAVKELKELNKTLKQNREEVEKTEKVEEKASQRLNRTISGAGRAAMILGAAKTAISLLGIATKKIEENADWSNLKGGLNSPNVSSKNMATLQFASRQYGGTKETVFNDLSNINSVISQLKKGINPLGDLPGMYPGLMDAFIKPGGEFYGEMDVLSNLSKMLPRLDPYLQRDLIKQIGLSDSTFQLLLQRRYDSILESFSEKAEEAVKKSEENRSKTDRIKDVQQQTEDWIRNNIYSPILDIPFAPEAFGLGKAIWDNGGGEIVRFLSQYYLLKTLLERGGQPWQRGLQKGAQFLSRTPAAAMTGFALAPMVLTNGVLIDAFYQRKKRFYAEWGHQSKQTSEFWKLYRKQGILVPELYESKKPNEALKKINERLNAPAGETPFDGKDFNPEVLKSTDVPWGAFSLPTMPQRYIPGVTGTGDIVVTIGDLNINAPGGDPAQIAAAGNALMEQFRDEVTAIFHGIDRNFATETMA